MASRRSLVLEAVEITHINGSRLPQPISGNAVFHLRPRFRFTVDFSILPGFLRVAPGVPCQIRTTTGIETEGWLSYSLNDVFHQTIKMRVSFVLKETPFTVVPADTAIRRVEFGVLNCCRFHDTDKVVTRRGTTHVLGAATNRIRDFRIDITERLATRARTPDDYAITHTGVLRHDNGKPFSGAEADNVLRRLRAYLSFLRGASCSLAPVRAVLADGEKTGFWWGAPYVEPHQNRDTWLLENSSRAVSSLLPEFDRLCGDWGETLPTIVDWYINANRSAMHVALVLAQAALEALGHKLVGESDKRKAGNNAEKLLRFMLVGLNVDVDIPGTCNALRAFSSQHVRTVKRGWREPYAGDGPEILVQLRNDLVHHKGRFPRFSGDVQQEAMRLSRGYVEVVLLKRLGFSGWYFDRLRGTTSVL